MYNWACVHCIINTWYVLNAYKPRDANTKPSKTLFLVDSIDIKCVLYAGHKPMSVILEESNVNWFA